MTNGIQRMLCACLLAALLAGCDSMAGFGPIQDEQGSLDGHEISSFVVHLESESGSGGSYSSDQLRAALQIAVAYLDDLEIEDYEIARHDNGSLLLKVRKVDEEGEKRIIDALAQVTKLELHQVSERSNELGVDGKTLAQRVLDGDEIVVGQKAYIQKYKDSDGNERSESILLYRRAGITAEDIAQAMPSPQEAEAVMITLNENGTEKMISLTKGMRPGIDRIAILLNDEVVSAPVVNQVPLGKNFIIQGLNEPGEVEKLAADLMHPTGKSFRVELMK